MCYSYQKAVPQAIRRSPVRIPSGRINQFGHCRKQMSPSSAYSSMASPQSSQGSFFLRSHSFWRSCGVACLWTLPMDCYPLSSVRPVSGTFSFCLFTGFYHIFPENETGKPEKTCSFPGVAERLFFSLHAVDDGPVRFVQPQEKADCRESQSVLPGNKL